MSRPPGPFRYAYLHGFSSSSRSTKGVFLASSLGEVSIELELLDLNVPSFAEQTYTASLGVLDRLDAGRGGGFRWRLIGSSLGGYLAARWAELHPERVESLVLLCPAFDLPSLWPVILGEEALGRWETDGFLELPDDSGAPRPIPWRFSEDARTHTPYPEIRCPARILHGIRDEVVPIEYSRRFARSRPNVELVELDDDHSLDASLDRIAAEAREFFGI